jgi:hypothetical protein
MNLCHATALALAFGLFGCSAVPGIETAYLKNPNTGNVVTCWAIQGIGRERRSG